MSDWILYKHTYTHMHIYMHTQLQLYKHTHKHIIHTNIHTHTYIHIDIYVYLYTLFKFIQIYFIYRTTNNIYSLLSIYSDAFAAEYIGDREAMFRQYHR